MGSRKRRQVSGERDGKRKRNIGGHRWGKQGRCVMPLFRIKFVIVNDVYHRETVLRAIICLRLMYLWVYCDWCLSAAYRQERHRRLMVFASSKTPSLRLKNIISQGLCFWPFRFAACDHLAFPVALLLSITSICNFKKWHLWIVDWTAVRHDL